MQEKFLYSDNKSFPVEENQLTINDCFREEIKKSDHIEISVGFSSFYSLRELSRLVAEQKIKNISVILGMYFFNGFPKPLHQLALEINKKWQDSGIGEIRLIHSFRYHGKLYCFLKDSQVFSTIIGSANLSFLVDTEQTRQEQYEVALFTDNSETLTNALEHIQKLKSKNISENIAILEEKKLLSIIKTRHEKQEGMTRIA